MPPLLQNIDVFEILIRVFVLFTAMPVHEFAHAATAVRFGDNTPIRQGRYTLNPFSHLSPIGSIALLFLGFGWAKPVQVESRNFKNPKLGMAVVSIMGPVSNILLALFALILQKILIGVLPSIRLNNAVYMIYVILLYVVDLNLLLAVFNLLPIPPLDGSNVLSVFLPYRGYELLTKYEGVITVALLLLLYTGYLFVPLDYLRGLLLGGLNWLTIPIDRLFGGVGPIVNQL